MLIVTDSPYRIIYALYAMNKQGYIHIILYIVIILFDNDTDADDFCVSLTTRKPYRRSAT